MADLLSELQHLQSGNWRHNQENETARPSASTVADPVLLDEVYSIVAAKQNWAGVPLGAGNAAFMQQAPQLQQTQQKQVSWGSNTISSCSNSSNTKQTAIQAPGSGSNSCTSLLATSTAAAAVAAYRRQYLGLDAAATSSTAAVQQHGVQGSKPGFVLKSRPNGLSPPDYGPWHRAGYLPQPTGSAEQAAVLNLPAKSGTGMVIPLAQMMPDSCCPPQYPEPLVAMSPDAKAIIAEHQAQRVLAPGSVLNHLVFDSLEHPDPAGSNLTEPWCLSNPGSITSSARTTLSACSTRSNSMVRDKNSAAEEAAQQTVATARLPAGYGSPGCTLAPWYVPMGPDDVTLLFESRFECGNLRRAVQVYPFEYDLVLQPDINTRGHTQWYYFSVSNMRAGQPYRFNIINLIKPDSLYNMGMLPLMHSRQQLKSKGIGWIRSGYDVCYGPNSIRQGKHQTYFTLTFEMKFPHSEDLVHLAHCYPYSYTDLQNHLYTICKDPSPSIVVERSTLANSLAGNAVDVLSITAPEGSGKPMSQRQGVVLSARVHPGETNASWMMKGALQQLLSNCSESVQLRENFVFKVVPMLNPDGVIVGNYRCSLAGLDLNRVWQEPDGRIHPVIQAFKEMIRAFVAEREVALFVDMHGHSRKHGVFCYGCEKKGARDTAPQAPGWPAPGSVGMLPGISAKNLERLFPLMLYINAPDLFSYMTCNFKVQKSKAGTGRVVGFRELGLVNAYTIEASFCGASVGKFAKQHFNTGHLEDMGSALVRTLLDYWAPIECSSAAELSAQLLAAGSGSGAAAAAQSALGLLVDTAAAADEDDDCTDSDDESSEEDEKPEADKVTDKSQVAGQLSRKRSNTQGLAAAAAAAAGSALASSAAAAAATAAHIGNNVAELSNQLVAMLSGATSVAAGAVGCFTGSVGSDTCDAAAMPSSAVAVLLTALKGASSAATADAGPATAGAAARNCSSSKNSSTRRRSSRNASSQGFASNSSSSTAQHAIQFADTAAAVKAAQQLLEKLLAKKTKQQAGSAATEMAATESSAGTAAVTAAEAPCGTLYTTGKFRVGQQVASGATAAAAAAGARVGSSNQSGVMNAEAAGSSGSSKTDASNPASLFTSQPTCQLSAGATPSHKYDASSTGSTDSTAAVQLTAEEEALANMPGLMDLLQQLVDEHTALTAVVGSAAAAGGGDGGSAAGGGKKKGRRRGLARYGNPEVLRAARAKADAGLAAALPELEPMLCNQGEFALTDASSRPATCGAAFASSTSFSPLNLSATGDLMSPGPHSSNSSSSDWPACLQSFRRGNTAGGRGSSSRVSVLDAERYIDLLDKQKRHTGGVLASSNIDDPWVYSASNSSASSSARTTRSAQSTGSFKGQLGSAAAVAAAGAAGSSSSSTSTSAAAGGFSASKGNLPWGVSADVQQNAAAAVAVAAASDRMLFAAAGDHLIGATAGAGPLAGRRRRSKSAHAWFRTDSFDKQI